jgi:hypothetical protein
MHISRKIQMKEESCKQDVSWLKNAATIKTTTTMTTGQQN